jgi:hypothetical protein
MSQNKDDLYKIALGEGEEEVETGEHESVRLFKSTLKLETGFYKKPIEFFYWLYCKLYGKVEYKSFTKLFIGRMVKFDKKHLSSQIQNYTELVFEYEKEQFRKKRRVAKKKKSKLIEISKTRQEKGDKS